MIRDPLAVYNWLNARYGDAVRCPLTPRHAIFLFARPEHAEHVLAANQDNYVKAFTYRPLRAVIGDGLLTAEHEHWRRHRRLLQPMFSRRDVMGYGPAMAAAIARRLAIWDELPDGTQVQAARQMSALTLDIVGSAVLGTDLTGAAGVMGAAMDAAQRVAVSANLLPLRWGPRSASMVRAATRIAGRSQEGIDGLTSRLIAERRAELDGHAAAGSDGTPDLLQRLIAARAEDGSPLTDDEIAAEVATFVLAGHETTSDALAWTLALLSAHPAARSRLEQEADEVLGGQPPQAADMARLPWTAATFREALRLYPPAWTIQRDALAGDTVAGLPVAAGDTVSVAPYLIHRNPEFWPDPAGFDPRRFLPGTELPHRYAWIPFGGGKRACIGQAFAEQEAVLTLASIAQRYRFELPPSGLPRPLAQVTLRPARGLPMRLLRRPGQAG